MPSSSHLRPRSSTPSAKRSAELGALCGGGGSRDARRGLLVFAHPSATPAHARASPQCPSFGYSLLRVRPAKSLPPKRRRTPANSRGSGASFLGSFRFLDLRMHRALALDLDQPQPAELE
jgi:hypothetical protein